MQNIRQGQSQHTSARAETASLKILNSYED
jgi:hypothetical protein